MYPFFSFNILEHVIIHQLEEKVHILSNQTVFTLHLIMFFLAMSNSSSSSFGFFVWLNLKMNSFVIENGDLSQKKKKTVITAMTSKFQLIKLPVLSVIYFLKNYLNEKVSHTQKSVKKKYM